MKTTDELRPCTTELTIMKTHPDWTPTTLATEYLTARASAPWRGALWAIKQARYWIARKSQPIGIPE